ncbi:MoxR family ATPase [Candidatus Obscuribacterales bacterium]|nr:MoxR family ATPase [Candidatus Obscuribacterales bacterium]
MITQNVCDSFSRLTAEMDKVVIGYASVKRLSIASMLADQHVLLEGLPGTAKSLFVEVFQRSVKNSKSVRVQMTADVKPMDLVGVKVWNPGMAAFVTEEGPLSGKNFVLIDEINRAPGKTLSSVLSSMQERRIYISGQEIVLPDPYFVMATQNPVEQEGVYPLPEAAVDRFAMKLVVPYASAADEELILANEALDSRDPQDVVKQVISIEEVIELRQLIKKGVYVSPAAMQYIVALVRATRPGLEEHAAIVKADSKFNNLIEVGSSVRGQLSIRGLARVLAAIKGRAFVTPEDIQEVVLPTLRHRVALTFEATANGTKSDSVIEKIVENVKFSKDTDQYAPKAA